MSCVRHPVPNENSDQLVGGVRPRTVLHGLQHGGQRRVVVGGGAAVHEPFQRVEVGGRRHRRLHRRAQEHAPVAVLSRCTLMQVREERLLTLGDIVRGQQEVDAGAVAGGLQRHVPQQLLEQAPIAGLRPGGRVHELIREEIAAHEDLADQLFVQGVDLERRLSRCDEARDDPARRRPGDHVEDAVAGRARLLLQRLEQLDGQDPADAPAVQGQQRAVLRRDVQSLERFLGGVSHVFVDCNESSARNCTVVRRLWARHRGSAPEQAPAAVLGAASRVTARHRAALKLAAAQNVIGVGSTRPR